MDQNMDQNMGQEELIREEPFEASQLPNPNVMRKDRKKKKKHRGLLGFILGFLLAGLLGIIVICWMIGTGYIPEDMGLISAETVQKIQVIQQQLNELYLFDQSETNTNVGMIKGYVDSYGDPYTVYYTPEEYSELMESTSGVYSGIGVVVQQNTETGTIVVVKPYADCPGALAGMKQGDIIYQVEGEDATGVDINLVVSKIKGPEGTDVNITVYRPSTDEYIDMKITRRSVTIETVSCEMLENQIGRITIDSFDEVTYEQFVACYEELETQGMKALIVDLRNNGGGLLDSAVNMLDYLLPAGIITYTEDKYGNRENYSSKPSAKLDIPCAILTNGYTASASEIFTGCMRDYDKAVIVGTTSFGKGIVQLLIPFTDGSALKVTSAYYYTPSGICIHGDGIEPDYPVEYDATAETDNQLQKAIEVMTEAIQTEN